MRPFGLFAIAAATAALGACASALAPSDDLSARMAADIIAMTPPVQPPVPFMTEIDTMRAALPAFDLQRDISGPRGDVSVARDLAFPAESSILPRPQVDRLVPLQAYLRDNPATAVRIEGHGDGLLTGEQEIDLSHSRAQAVARAILTDMRIYNSITAEAAPSAKGKSTRGGWAEIILVMP